MHDGGPAMNRTFIVTTPRIVFISTHRTFDAVSKSKPRLCAMPQRHHSDSVQGDCETVGSVFDKI
jgi:hypothetical protein